MGRTGARTGARRATTASRRATTSTASRGVFSRPAHKLAGQSYVGRILVLDTAKGGVASAWMLHEMAVARRRAARARVQQRESDPRAGRGVRRRARCSPASTGTSPRWCRTARAWRSILQNASWSLSKNEPQALQRRRRHDSSCSSTPRRSSRTIRSAIRTCASSRVWLPPQYDDGSAARRRFPVLYDLVGFTGSGLAHVELEALRRQRARARGAAHPRAQDGAGDHRVPRLLHRARRQPVRQLVGDRQLRRLPHARDHPVRRPRVPHARRRASIAAASASPRAATARSSTA